MSRTYNRRAGIERAIASLEGFRALADARLEAGYDRGEQIGQFVVLGRWLLDMAGNTEVILDGISDEVRSRMPKVCTPKELNRYLGEGWTLSTRIQHLPPAGATCPGCGVDWTIENCHDTWWSRDGVPYHTACHRLIVAPEHEVQIRSVVTGAGFADVGMLAIASKDSTIVGWPWFQVTTELGEFVIGWRHSVIQIDWSTLDERHHANVAALFRWRNISQGEMFVYAHNPEQATAFLRLIRLHLAAAR